jgi:hypothetical protein
MRAAVVLALVAMLAACGDEPVPTSTAAPTSSTAAPEDPGGGPLQGPPDVVVHGDEGPVSLRPYTFCYGNGCADGTPPEDPPAVGSPAEVTVDFPLPGWTFSANLQAAGDECAREQHVDLERTGPTTFVLRPAGPAATYRVDLFGQGDGDLFVRFLWTTPVDGPMPEPAARLAVLADHDGEVDSYGVELQVSNLAATPASAEATVTVTAADGRALTFEAARARAMYEACDDLEGSLYWDGPDDEGLRAAALGDPPFSYEVVLTLDGVRHVAMATWPDDEIAGNEPSVALEFEPALPALSG